jgi:hypothetical protein
MEYRTMIIEWQPTNKPAAPAAQPTAAQLERRRRYALTLCRNAANATSLALANRMVRVWLDCGCEELLANEGTNQNNARLADGSDLQVAGKSVSAGDKRSLAGQ